MRSRLLAGLALVSLLSGPALAESATVVADIFPGAASSTPKELTAIGTQLFFTAVASATAPRALYVVETTTGALTELAAEPEWTLASSAPAFLTGGSTLLYFVASTTSHGLEVWRSDGTVVGTFRVSDIAAGATSTFFGGAFGTKLVANGDRLYFHASDSGAVYGDELWQSEGTEATTTIVADISPGVGSSSPHKLTVIDGRLYFFAGGDLRIWSGTTLQTNVNVGAFGSVEPPFWGVDSPTGRKVIGEVSGPSGSGLYEIAEDGAVTLLTNGTYGNCGGAVAAGSLVFLNGPSFGLWTTDGATAQLVKSPDPGGGGCPRSWIVTGDAKVCFGADNGTDGVEPWCSDGTEAGTQMIGITNEPDEFALAGGDLYWSAASTLWKAAGPDFTGGVTEIDFNLNPGSTPVPSELTVVNGALYMAATRSSVAGKEIVVLCPGCAIDGQCRSDGEVNLANACQKCDVASDPDAWSANAAASCDDGDACTENDLCVGTVCAGTDKVCPDPGECQVPSCEPATGVCGGTAEDDTTPCDDGDLCTQTDACTAGACVGANDVVCTASDQCHDAGTCDPATGVCDDPAKSNGQACDDASACTGTDTCQGGVCLGADPVVCSALSQCHDAGTCDPASGVCDDPAKASGETCDDGNACTTVDTCDAGACNGAAPVVCSALDDCHVAGVCDPSNGQCSNPNAGDGLGCDDSDACTGSSSCQAGVCTGADDVVCSPLDSCHVAGTCDPGTGQCSNPNAGDGLGCDDADACTGSSTCQAGVCTGADDVVCAALDTCHVAGVCDPATGQCSNPNADDGTACDDGNACSTPDQCTAGVCLGSAAGCNDNDPCTDDSCDDVTGCVSAPTVIPCDDGNPCTTDFCTAMVGCEASNDDAAPCDDGEPCTENDGCSAGSCGGSAVVCDDGNACTLDVCTPGVGCEASNDDSLVCDDGDPCTGDDACSGGVCGGTFCPPPVDLDACLTTTCTAQGCELTAVAGSCDDGDPCTENDTCTGGACGGSPVSCPATGDPCTAAVCDPAQGCTSEAANDGGGCDDGDACTQTDSCSAGSCAGGAPVFCADPIDPCQSSTCNAVSGQCEITEVVDCGACDDHPAFCIHDLSVTASVQAAATQTTAGRVGFEVTNLGPDMALAQLGLVVPDDVFVDVLSFGGATCVLPGETDLDPLDGVKTVSLCVDLLAEVGAPMQGAAIIDAAGAGGDADIEVRASTIGADPVEANDFATVTLPVTGGTVSIAPNSAPSGAVPAGTAAPVWFVVRNTASSAATGVSVSIVVSPVGAPVVVDSGAGPVDCPGGACDVSLANIAPGGSAAFAVVTAPCADFSVQVTLAATLDGSPVNGATQFAVTVGGTCSACAGDPSACSADLALGAPAMALTNEAVPLSIDNDGPDDAVGVSLAVSVSSQVFNVALSSGGTPALSCVPGAVGMFTCPVGTIPTGGTWTGGLHLDTSGTGTATVDLTLGGATPDPDLSDNTSSVQAVVTQGQLVGALTVNGAPAAGDDATLTFSVTNETGVVLSNVVFGAALTGTGAIATVEPASAATMNPGQTIDVTVTLAGCGALSVVATATADAGAGLTASAAKSVAFTAGEACECVPHVGCPPSAAATDDACVTTTCDAATLTCVDATMACVATDPCRGSTCIAGSCFDFLLAGQQQSCADGVALNVTAAPGASAGVAQVDVGYQPLYAGGRPLTLLFAASGGDAAWVGGPSVSLGDVSAAGSAAATLVACAALTVDVTVSDDTATLGHVQTTVAPMAPASCSPAASLSVIGGSATELAFDVTNTGDVPLPLAFSVAGATPASAVVALGGADFPAAIDGAELATRALLAPGTSATLSLVLDAAPAGALTLSLAAPFGGASLAEVTVQGTADLAIAVDAGPTELAPRAVVELTGIVENVSSTTAPSAVLSIGLPDGQTLDTVRVDGTVVSCPDGSCPLGDVTAGATLSFIIGLAAAPAQGGPVQVGLSVTSSGVDPTPADNAAEVDFEVPGAVELTLADASGAGGTALAYEVGLRNVDPAAPVTGLGIALTVSGPSGTFASGPAGVFVTGGCTVGVTGCAFFIESLGAGATRSVPLRVRGCGPLTLTATATIDGVAAQLAEGAGFVAATSATITLTECQTAPSPTEVTITPTPPAAQPIEAAPGDEVKIMETKVENPTEEPIEITEITLGTETEAWEDLKLQAGADELLLEPIETNASELVLKLSSAFELRAKGSIDFRAFAKLTLLAGTSHLVPFAPPGGSGPVGGPAAPLLLLAFVLLVALLQPRRKLLYGFAFSCLLLGVPSCGDDAGTSEPAATKTVQVELRSIKARLADGTEVELVQAPTTTATINVVP